MSKLRFYWPKFKQKIDIQASLILNKTSFYVLCIHLDVSEMNKTMDHSIYTKEMTSILGALAFRAILLKRVRCVYS